MNAALLCVWFFGAGALFDVQTIPLPGTESTAFLAHADTDGRVDVFVIQAQTLFVHATEGKGQMRTMRLLDGTSAIDVADIDDDGRNELISVVGDRVFKHTIPSVTGEQSKIEELFTCENLLATRSFGEAGSEYVQPYPWVLVGRQDKKVVIALPSDDGTELRTLEGESLENQGGKVPSAEIFSAWSSNQQSLGAGPALDFHVRYTVEPGAYLTDTMGAAAADARPTRLGGPVQAYNAFDHGPASWPWFQLKRGQDDSKRVLFSYSQGATIDTVVRIRDRAKPNSGRGNKKLGPVRRYPGMLLVARSGVPDFNGDGYADLLLWRAPKPGASVGVLSRAVTEQTWPLRLTVHLFMPSKMRFEAMPSTSIACRVPVAWVMASGFDAPLRSILLDDFNGDGRTDLAFSAAPRDYSVWLYGDNAFSKAPDFSRRFDEPIKRIEFSEELSADGTTSIGLRTATAIYLLRAEM